MISKFLPEAVCCCLHTCIFDTNDGLHMCTKFSFPSQYTLFVPIIMYGMGLLLICCLQTKYALARPVMDSNLYIICKVSYLYLSWFLTIRIRLMCQEWDLIEKMRVKRKSKMYGHKYTLHLPTVTVHQ